MAKRSGVSRPTCHALTEYKHPFLVNRDQASVGVILITSDKGLCGGLNSNLLRLAVVKMKEFDAQGKKFQATCIGNKGLGFMQRVGAKVVSHVTALGDTPHLEKLIGPVKLQLDAYMKGEIDALYIGYNRFINTMKQEPVFEQLLPLSGDAVGSAKTKWDYIYEPDAKAVIDDLLLRYVEALIYQAVAENIASEQSARMVAMKSASDNAKTVIGELKLVYNKTRQAAITKELSEIVSGAAAV
jgi:F-type H+-transporting ATPase subunit gamma